MKNQSRQATHDQKSPTRDSQNEGESVSGESDNKKEPSVDSTNRIEGKAKNAEEEQGKLQEEIRSQECCGELFN